MRLVIFLKNYFSIYFHLKISNKYHLISNKIKRRTYLFLYFESDLKKLFYFILF